MATRGSRRVDLPSAPEGPLPPRSGIALVDYWVGVVDGRGLKSGGISFRIPSTRSTGTTPTVAQDIRLAAGSLFTNPSGTSTYSGGSGGT